VEDLSSALVLINLVLPPLLRLWLVKKFVFNLSPWLLLAEIPTDQLGTDQDNLVSAFNLSAFGSGGSPVADKSSWIFRLNVCS